MKPFRYPCPPQASRHSCMASLQVHVTKGFVADTIAWISETLAGWNRRFSVTKEVEFTALKYTPHKHHIPNQYLFHLCNLNMSKTWIFINTTIRTSLLILILLVVWKIGLCLKSYQVRNWFSRIWHLNTFKILVSEIRNIHFQGTGGSHVGK
jgi:hypothetical protein